MDFEFGAHCAPNLTWSHYRLIMRLTDKNAVKYFHDLVRDALIAKHDKAFFLPFGCFAFVVM